MFPWLFVDERRLNVVCVLRLQIVLHWALIRLPDTIRVPVFFHDDNGLSIAQVFYDKHVGSLCGCKGDEEHSPPCGCTVLKAKDEASDS